MGADARTSPLDGDGRFRGLDNLYVTDGSALPRSAALNPSLTIAANALRIGIAHRRAVTTVRPQRACATDTRHHSVSTNAQMHERHAHMLPSSRCVGLLAGTHASIWGMYKDAIHEGFAPDRVRAQHDRGRTVRAGDSVVSAAPGAINPGRWYCCSGWRMPLSAEWSRCGRRSFATKISRSTSSRCSSASTDGRCVAGSPRLALGGVVRGRVCRSCCS